MFKLVLLLLITNIILIGQKILGFRKSLIFDLDFYIIIAYSNVLANETKIPILVSHMFDLILFDF